MKLILKKDVKSLGKMGDVVVVADGYARNYLIPQGFAILANAANSKMMAENIKQAAHKAEKIKADAEAIANGIGEMSLEIKAKAGDSGKIFGAVTTLQISDALKAKGFDVDRKKISFKGEVKMIGDYVAEIDLHKEVKKDVAFSVVAE